VCVSSFPIIGPHAMLHVSRRLTFVMMVFVQDAFNVSLHMGIFLLCHLGIFFVAVGLLTQRGFPVVPHGAIEIGHVFQGGCSTKIVVIVMFFLLPRGVSSQYRWNLPLHTCRRPNSSDAPTRRPKWPSALPSWSIFVVSGSESVFGVGTILRVSLYGFSRYVRCYYCSLVSQDLFHAIFVYLIYNI
jgi:hypothetical protein